MPIDPVTLEESLKALAEHPDPEPYAALQALVDGVQKLFELDGAGLMLTDTEGALRYVAASDKDSQLLEEAQAQLGAGPCVESMVRNTIVASSDLRADERWPELGEQVGDVRAVLGVPVRLAGGAVGSLNVYVDVPHDWAEDERRALSAYSELVEHTLGGALALQRASELAGQLQFALDNRVLIERAVGYLMGKLGMADTAAFAALRRHARSGRRRVKDVAEDVLRTGTL